MTKKHFEKFDPVSAKQWKQKIQYDLNGADYNETLVWQSNEGISVKPFYHSDDFKEYPTISNTQASKWKICQFINADNEEEANLRAKRSIDKGAESLLFIINSSDVSLAILLHDIDLASTFVYIEAKFLSVEWIENAKNYNVVLINDVIGNLAKTGNWHHNLNQDFSDFKHTLKRSGTLFINTTLYQNAGANIVQQLAYALAHANEYLNYYTQPNSAEKIKNIIFKVAISTNYFFEIAKLKALRILWPSIAKEYSLNPDCDIIATPTKRNQTIYDYNINMLRTTTECMSAILGGANIICNLPYDSVYHNSNEFADRIAINQLLILRHESYFDKVDNPSDGAYYIETLTDQLSEKALSLFKNIEANGGFLKQLKEGTIQRKIKESASKENLQFKNGDEVLVGTNKYPNPNDKMKENIEISPFIKKSFHKTLIEPIVEKRLAEKLENQRLKIE